MKQSKKVVINSDNNIVGADLIKKLLEKYDTLQNMDLTNVDLQGVNLENAELRDTNFFILI